MLSWSTQSNATSREPVAATTSLPPRWLFEVLTVQCAVYGYQVIGRQTRSGNKLWYEVHKNGRKESDTDWEPLMFLEKMPPYVLKLVRNYDEECKSMASGMDLRPITAIEVRNHLKDFGIDEDLASQKIKRMSGGQRSRLVLAAANWSRPHVIALVCSSTPPPPGIASPSCSKTKGKRKACGVLILIGGVVVVCTGRAYELSGQRHAGGAHTCAQDVQRGCGDDLA